MGILSITVGSSICGFASWKVLRVARKHGRCFSFSSINQYQSVGKVNTQRNKTNPQKSQEQINYINGDVGDVAKKTQVSRSLSNSRLSVDSPHPTGVQNIFSTVHNNG
jgi:hypothetical protein